MSGTVLLVGALDTKGAEYAFVKDLIEAAGLQTLVVDFGVMGQPAFEPDVGRAEVAAAGGGDLAYLASGTHKDEAMRTMAQGLASVVERLYGEGRFDGILGMGGSGGTSIATSAMRTLPVGVPKVMVSTVGGGDVSPYAGSKDITFMPSVVDVAGINRLSRAIYANAAGAIAGMVKTEAEATADERPLIAASMFGNTTAAVDHARGLLEAEGYEVLVFHATGSGGRTMEDLIRDGYIAGCLDMTTTELADEICDGVFSAGPDRVQAAPGQGVPTVIVPGCVDMANFGGIETVPDHYRERTLYEWNPEVTLLRTNDEENRQMGVMLAAAANAGQAGKVSVLIPLGGVSMLDSEGDRFWDPGADQACYDALRNDLRADIPLIEMDANINDPEFAEKAVALLLEMLQE
ncbi:MAG: Tm-1-like ATP-binding domain-containing protein [Caldilineaceae bacterium]|nr:Tm-1-like ATP-binding domain-containing protein [Caldilineaceae bacterium]MDE0337765.1 Tm-1-like ATP-binding domain-containing protein [Caldilineaceae bacterium]